MNSSRKRLAAPVALATLLASESLASAEGVGNADNNHAGQRAASSKPEFGRALAVVGAGFELGGRRVEYTDLVIENLRTYSIQATPVVRVFADAYPWARQSESAVLPNLGVGLVYAGAPGLASTLATGDSIATSWHRFEAMLRYRHRIGKKAGAPVLFAGLGYAFAGFVIHASEPLAETVPSASYHSVRFAASGYVPLGPIALRAEAAYRLPLGQSVLLSRFRDGSVGGVDATIGLSIPIVAGFEARGGASYTRYFYSFYPNPGDPYIAGGALDEYWGFELGAAHVF